MRRWQIARARHAAFALLMTVATLAPTFVFITFWVGLAFACALFGDIFRAVNPWRALGRAGGWIVRRGRAGPPRRRYPPGLGVWPAVAGLLAFAWIELVDVRRPLWCSPGNVCCR